MKTKEEIKQILSSHKDEIKRKYPIKELALFGSYSRGEQSPASDIDILVEFEKPIGLDFVSLADYLEELLEQKVDLVSKPSIKPNLLKYRERTIQYV
jgi:predicted nucleotidyltransferase